MENGTGALNQLRFTRRTGGKKRLQFMVCTFVSPHRHWSTGTYTLPCLISFSQLSASLSTVLVPSLTPSRWARRGATVDSPEHAYNKTASSKSALMAPFIACCLSNGKSARCHRGCRWTDCSCWGAAHRLPCRDCDQSLDTMCSTENLLTTVTFVQLAPTSSHSVFIVIVK